MASDGATNISAALVARELGVDRRTVHDWFNSGCPRTSIDDVKAWRANNKRTEHTPLDRREIPGPDGTAEGGEPRKRKLTLSERRMMADTRKIIEEVEFKQFRNLEKRKELVSRTQAEREIAQIVVLVKQRLLAAPDEFETRFPADIRSALKADFQEFIRQLLLELSRQTAIDKSLDEIIVAEAERIVDHVEPKPAPSEAA